MKNCDDTGLDARQLRAVGAVMGALVGDAAGGVLEFIGRAPTQQEVGEAIQMPGGGIFELAPGQFTDDGEMTVCLVRALLAAKGAYRPELAAQYYCEWKNSRPFDIGMATRAALGIKFAKTQTPTQVLMLVRAQALENNAESKANGSLMRASPLGISACGCTEEEAIALALSDAQLTHPNLACQHSTAAYVLALRHLMLTPGDNMGAIFAAQAYVQTQSKEVTSWLADAVSGQLPDAFPMAGFVRYGFTYAFHYLQSGASFERAITETLLRGGDTDTNACIVGGLMGAYHGLNGLPKLALEGVLKCNTQFGRRRPDNFTVVPVMHNLTLLSQYCLPKKERVMKENSAKPALRVSHIVHGRMAVKNRVHYLIDPKGKGSERAVPESVVLKRWRKRRFPNYTFSGARLSSTLWRAVHQEFGGNLSQWVGRSVLEIEENIKTNRVGLKAGGYLSLPSAETLHALFMTCGLVRLQTIIARHTSSEHKGKSSVPDLFLFATNQTTGLPSIARFVEVKKPEEPASAVQLEEIDFLNGLGLHARVLRLIEAE